MKFTPLSFQGPLAAGGVALMPFVLLQFTVPHEKALITLSDIEFTGLGIFNTFYFISLFGIMLLFTIIHLILTVNSLIGLVKWLSKEREFINFINTPLSNIGIFSPIVSLTMSMNVILGPAYFFITKISANLQIIMWPALISFAILSLIFFILEIKIFKIWLNQAIDLDKLNFGWLLDAFALGMLSLVGTGIASLSNTIEIASTAAFIALFTLSFGFILFISKLLYLIYHQLRSITLPTKQAQPTFFVVIPISCLFGVSLYKFYVYLEKYFFFNIKFLSYFVITFSFVIAIGWGIFCLHLLSDYFKNEFVKNEFYPGQWTIVCALVGSEVLASYVYGNFYANLLFIIFNYISILLASIIFILILTRYYQANYRDKINPVTVKTFA
jgi:tellurite resistance protein TehA-like permease